jgi:uncharacterized protein YndB with AHSA1/START domain
MDINPHAPVTVDLRIEVAASPATVWRLHTDINAWTTWHPDIVAARIDGELAVGAVFDWTTAGLDISSTVGELIPERRIAWGGETHGIDGIHVWTFEPSGTGVVVRTRESWDGEPVLADPDGLRDALRGSLESWLQALKATAETTAPERR